MRQTLSSNVVNLHPVLAEGDVDVIVTELARWAAVAKGSNSGLSEEEVRKAHSLPGSYRARFLGGRTFLRHVLAHYVGCAPGELLFGYGPAGKPMLTNTRQDVRFNLSHSGDLAACAVRTRDDVGVDVEVVREVRSLERIAERVLPADSSAAVVRAVGRRKRDAFLRAWTRREAVTKLLGVGLMTRGPAWYGVSTYDLELDPRWVGAVAVHSPSRPPTVRSWMFSSAEAI